MGAMNECWNVRTDPVAFHENNYPNIRAVLGKLGFAKVSPVQAHQNHFHVYLKPPTALDIGGAHKLEAEGSANSSSASTTAVDTATFAQQSEALLAYVQSTITPGEQIMFAMDMPYTAVQDAPIVLAQAASASGLGQIAQNQKLNYVIFDCQQVESGSPSDSAERSIDPALGIKILVGTKQHPIDENSISVQVLEEPKHGKLRTEIANTGYRFFAYDPAPGYLGKDKVVFLAESGGKRYKVVTTLAVVKRADERPEQTICPPNQVIKVNALPMQNIQSNGVGVTINISPLDGSTLGSTQGSTITLDDNAAGYGWYIAPNPAANTDFLPTSDPNVWLAAPGSAAAGKMDMLSVLLHEYGHALGLDHSANPNDFMSPNLQPSERRLPSAAELTLMSQLAAQLNSDNSATALASSTAPAPTSPAAPVLPIGTALSALLIGRLRRTDYGALSPVITNAQIPAPQFELAINATLTNNNFAGGTPAALSYLIVRLRT